MSGPGKPPVEGPRHPRNRPDRGPAAVPQIPTLASAEEGFETFRETLLLWVTDPNLNQALRVVGTALHDMVLEHSQYGPERPGLLAAWDLRAALGDLRHIQGFLAGVGSEPENSDLDPVEASLCAFAAAEAKAVAAIADRIEQRLADHALLTLVVDARAEPVRTAKPSRSAEAERP